MVHIELSPEQLDTLISEIAGIKTTLQGLKSNRHVKYHLDDFQYSDLELKVKGAENLLMAFQTIEKKHNEKA